MDDITIVLGDDKPIYNWGLGVMSLHAHALIPFIAIICKHIVVMVFNPKTF
jgi:hypothetical protein